MSGFEKLVYLPGLQLKQPSKRNYGRGNNLELSVLLYKIENFGWLGQENEEDTFTTGHYIIINSLVLSKTWGFGRETDL